MGTDRTKLFEPERRPPSAVAIAVCLAIAASLAGATQASDEKVVIAIAAIDPALMSPADANGVRDVAFVRASVAVDAIAALRGVARRASTARDDASFAVEWMLIVVDDRGRTVAYREGATPLEAGGVGRAGAGVDLEAAWDGFDDEGRPVPDGLYEVVFRTDAVRTRAVGRGRLQRQVLGSDVTTFAVEVDNTAPAVRIEGVPACDRGPVEPVVSVDDPEAVVEWALDGVPVEASASIEGEGDHDLVVTATDRAGNVGAASVAFTLDATPPAIEVLGVEDGAEVAAGTVVDVRFDDPNLVETSLTLDGVTFAAGTAVDAPGVHVLEARAADCAGNLTEIVVRFTTLGESDEGTQVFVHPGDPALFSATRDASSVVVFGSKADDGLASGVDAMEIAHDAGRLRVEAREGRLARVVGSNGERVEVSWPSTGEVQVAIVSSDGGVRSEEVLDWSAPPASAPVSSASNGGVCVGEVAATACGDDLVEARLGIVATPADDDGPSVAFPVVRDGAGSLAYRLPCGAAVTPSASDACRAGVLAAAPVCGQAAELGAAMRSEVCERLASRFAHLAPRAEPVDVESLGAACVEAFEAVAGGCATAAAACEAGVPDSRDRWLAGPYALEVTMTDDAVGTVVETRDVGGTETAPTVEVACDGAPVVTRLRAEWQGDDTYVVRGRVGCAAAGSEMVYDVELCDLDGPSPWCGPFVWREAVEGSGEIAFALTGRYGADVFRVRFGLEGGPSRQIVVGF